jgi:hypothetical protein
MAELDRMRAETSRLVIAGGVCHVKQMLPGADLIAPPFFSRIEPLVRDLYQEMVVRDPRPLRCEQYPH